MLKQFFTTIEQSQDNHHSIFAITVMKSQEFASSSLLTNFHVNLSGNQFQVQIISKNTL